MKIPQKNNVNMLLDSVSTLLYKSFNNLNESDKNQLKTINGYKKIFTNDGIKKYIPQLISNLTNDKIKFDNYFNQIHFKNGYYNFEHNKFFPRHRGEHYITNCINYDYMKSNSFDERKIYKMLKKIYPKADILDAMLSIIGSALTGQAIRGSYILFLIGNASAGKSTILDMTKSTVECYLKQIKPDTFVEGKNQDKIVNTYSKGSYIRITWLNEPKDKTFDVPFLKAWADGECNAERLYEEGSHDFKHYSLTIFTANTMPRLKLDGGVRRRVKAYEHTSKFTTNKSEVNESEHIYLAEEDFKTDFDNNLVMKLAFFNLIAQYAYEWLVKSKKIILPIEFTETTNNVLESNDIIKDFIDGNLIITNNEKDKIGKNKMLEIFNKAYPNKHFEVTQLTTLLKEKGLKYNRQLRCEGVQGSFSEVKWKGDISAEDEKSDLTLEQQIQSLENQKYGIEQMILKLKQQIEKPVNHVITSPNFEIELKKLKLLHEKKISLIEDQQQKFESYILQKCKEFGELNNSTKDVVKVKLTQKQEMVLRKRQVQNRDDQAVNDREIVEYANTLNNISILKFIPQNKGSIISKDDFDI